VLRVLHLHVADVVPGSLRQLKNWLIQLARLESSAIATRKSQATASRMEGLRHPAS
jgi:hypothetical protein